MDKLKKLELTWIGKDNRPRLEPRILLTDPEKSYSAPHRVTDNDIFDNRLIFGDNLLALKALEQEFAGKIKCIFIDPPYNTGSAFEHYDDGIEHSLWLSLMRGRLEALRALMSEDGSIWITIDDNEAYYLKVLCDEIFGRNNFVTSICWQKIHSLKNDARVISANHDFILLFAKNISTLKLNLLSRTKAMDSRYKNPDNDPRGSWQSGDLVANEHREDGNYYVTGPTGKQFTVPYNKHWVYSKENMDALIKENRIYFGRNKTAFPRKKRFLSEVQQGRTPDTWWTSAEVGHNQEAKREVKAFNEEEVFATPKPERLLHRVVQLASSPGDWVLDSFAGSGTTGAVAHKMGRRWIMVELGEHCHTHIIPRIKKVIDGSDQGGITKAMDWKGGGGFRYFRLAPSLLEKDTWGNWVISKDYNATMLASAMAKHEGFVYNPDETFYWKQGKSTEKDYIFTTTNFITVEYLDSIHEEMQPDESLLICCKSFQEACDGRHENITVKKIPNMLLGRCEFGKEDYSLNVADGQPLTGDDAFESIPVVETPARKEKKKSAPKDQPGLFDKEGENDDE